MKTRTIVLAVAAFSVVAIGGVVYAVAAGEDTRRVGAIQTYAASRALLLVDGQPAGFLASATCGRADAEVTRVDEGRNGPDPKQIGGPRYEPCQLAFGLSMGQEVYGWISDAMAGEELLPRNLTLQMLDYESKERRRIELQQALLTEFSMPAFDALSSDQVRMTIEVESEKLSAANGSGQVVSTSTAQQKSWSAASFKFELGGQPLAGISQVSSFGFEIQPKTLRPLFRDFTVTVTDAQSAALDNMFRSFVLNGQNAPQNEMKARLTMLSANQQDTLATLDLSGVGMVAGELAPKAPAGSDAAPTRNFTLYAEGASLNVVGPVA